MQPTRPTLKLLSVLVTLTAVVLLLWFSESLGLSTTSAGQDEKKATTPPENVEGSGDKKDEPAGGLHRFMRQKMQAST